MADDAVQAYLDHPPYYGKSAHQDNVLVRQLCGPTGKFDYDRKLWGTSCEEALRALISSQKWRPIGIERAWYAPLMRAAQAHRAKAEAEWHAQREAEAKAAKEAEAKKRAATWLADAGTRPKAKAKVASAAPAPAPAPAIARASWRKYPEEEKKAREGLAPTEAEAAECARLGFTEQAIAHSKTLNELGPRGSLSDEGRVLRYCALTLEHDEPVPELTREERRASWNYEQRWPLPEAACRAYAEKLNKEAAGALEEAEAR
jgi:hypothetical protein